MKKCWARHRRDCAGKLSREHLISNSLFDQQVVVSGYPWCNGETKVVGSASLTRKILCRKHNNDLSETDTEAVNFFRQLSEAAKMHVARRSRKQSGPRETIRTHVNGLSLERWFLKTAINLSLAGRSNLKWYESDTSLTDVPSRLVDAAFGDIDLAKPMGLYAVYVIGSPQKYESTVSFAPVLKSDTHIVGGTFSFRGLNFLLWLEGREIPSPASVVLRQEWSNCQISYRPSGLDFVAENQNSHAITYQWPVSARSRNRHIMSSSVGHRQLDLPEAQLLSDLYGIIRDLQTVSEFCRRLVDAWDADPIDNYLIDALSTAAVVRYCRCFEGGVRAKIDQDSVGSVDPRFTEFHDYLFALRQKHLQHSVNEFENNCVAVSVAEPPSPPEVRDVCVVGGRVAGLDRRSALNLLELSRKLAGAADSKYASEKSQLLEIVEGLPLEDVYQLPEPTAFEPDWRRAIKKRKRR